MTDSNFSGSEHLAYPDSIETTGRVDLSAPFGPGSTTAASNVKPNSAAEEERTMVLSLEIESVVLEDQLSMSVEYCSGREIARGGMGRIFAAEDPSLERTVALKVSSLKDAGENPQFMREARLLAHLAHPNIVPVHNLGKDPHGRPFYSMKLVKGRNLRAVIKSLITGDAETLATFTRQRLLDIFRKVCDAVSFAHSKGFLHRDLKPENIMVGEYGEVLVMDWGLAKPLRKHLSNAEAAKTQTPEPEMVSYVEGTPQYMSPEQAIGMFGGLDERSDIYSLGGTLFAILTLSSPVTGNSVSEVLQKIKEGKIETLSVPAGSLSEGSHTPMPERIPEALRAITLKAMAKDREERYASVNALLADIEAYQHGFATVAEQATLLRRVVLFVKRHRIASVLAMLLCLSASLFTIRLAASEREAVLSERRAVSNAKIAEANAQRAIEEKESARRIAAQAQISLAEVAEGEADSEQMRIALESVSEDLRDATWRYLNGRIDSADLNIKSPDKSSWIGLEPISGTPDSMLAVQDNGAFHKVDIRSGEITPLWEVATRGPLIKKSAGGDLSVSRDGTLLAFWSAPKTIKESESSAVEIRSINGGSLVSSLKIEDGERVFKTQLSKTLLAVSTHHSRSGQNKISILDFRSGQQLWERQEKAAGESSFLRARFDRDERSVLLLNGQGEIEELEARTGKLLKKGATPFPDHSFENEESFLPSMDRKQLYAIRGASIFKTLNSHDMWTGKLEFQTPLTAGFTRAIAHLPNQKLIACFNSQTHHSGSVELFADDSGRSIARLPFLGFISSFALGYRLRAQGNSLVLQLNNKILVWHLAFDSPAVRYEGNQAMNQRRNSVRMWGDSGGIIFTKSKNGNFSLVARKETTQQPEDFDEAVLPIKEASTTGSLLWTSNEGSKIVVGIGSHLFSYSLKENKFNLNWSASNVPVGSLAFHPTKQVLWLGDSVRDFSSGNVLATINRDKILYSEAYAEKADWIGADRVVEIVSVKSDDDPAFEALKQRMLRLWDA